MISSLRNLSALEKCSLALAAALLMCLLPLPYGFYTVIRLATAIVAACWAYQFYTRKKTVAAIAAGSVALLFQPFLKITLDRLTWNAVDLLLAAGIFIMIAMRKAKSMS